MLCSRRVTLNVAKKNTVASCQHHSHVVLEMRLVKGEVDRLSIFWWYVKARCPLGTDVLVKSRFWVYSRNLEIKFSSLHHVRSLLG